MKYTVKDLRVDFPDEEACLAWLVEWLHPNGITCKKCGKVTKHYKDKNRRSYSCSQCGNHMHPTAGTIAHNSHVPLTDWFYAIYMMSTNKAGTSAKQIERELGCSYRTAWRMMHQIRKLMEAPEGLLHGAIEVDETFVHANTFKRSSARRRYGYDARRTGQAIFGILQRGGIVKVWHVPHTNGSLLMEFFHENVKYGSTVHTDGYKAYRDLPKFGYEHKTTEHGRRQWVDYDDRSNYTQNIENVWSHFKRGIKGVYRHIGAKYLQLYAQEYAWRYSNRNKISMFWSLMGRIDRP
ncbi:MAG TPA: IS1595 family transposase [Candidatus Saccharimonadales bacterium]|nr:IS1595 family transposase [Candidatus Saccharimonadales bacterium]